MEHVAIVVRIRLIPTGPGEARPSFGALRLPRCNSRLPVAVGEKPLTSGHTAVGQSPPRDCCTTSLIAAACNSCLFLVDKVAVTISGRVPVGTTFGKTS